MKKWLLVMFVAVLSVVTVFHSVSPAMAAGDARYLAAPQVGLPGMPNPDFINGKTGFENRQEAQIGSWMEDKFTIGVGILLGFFTFGLIILVMLRGWGVSLAKRAEDRLESFKNLGAVGIGAFVIFSAAILIGSVFILSSWNG